MENEEIKEIRPLVLVAEDDDSNFSHSNAMISRGYSGRVLEYLE